MPMQQGLFIEENISIFKRSRTPRSEARCIATRTFCSAREENARNTGSVLHVLSAIVQLGGKCSRWGTRPAAASDGARAASAQRIRQPYNHVIFIVWRLPHRSPALPYQLRGARVPLPTLASSAKFPRHSAASKQRKRGCVPCSKRHYFSQVGGFPRTSARERNTERPRCIAQQPRRRTRRYPPWNITTRRCGRYRGRQTRDS
jgi:hypothetical protein